MVTTESDTARIRRLGGVAGIGVGVFVVGFALSADSVGTAFAPQVYQGGSVQPWIDNVVASPEVAMASLASACIGFGAMLVAAMSLVVLIRSGSWQKYLALSGYLIGVPVAISTFHSRLSLQQQIIVLAKNQPDLLPQLELAARIELQRFHLAAEYLGPFFIVLAGTPFLAWAARREGLLPGWLLWWAVGCALLTVVDFFERGNPAFAIAGLGAGPLHMLWFLAMGIVLLVGRARAG
jgi:hypothetical protein